jgi:hypothetical protein
VRTVLFDRLERLGEDEDATLLADGDGADVCENAPPGVLAVQLAEELLTGGAAVRRGDDGREKLAGDVPCEGACRRVDPPDDRLMLGWRGSGC